MSIRQHMLGLIRPLRASVQTNIQVVQTTILLKYRPLFQFLHRHAPKVAEEVQRAYVVSARAYYETCFRRYARSLGLVKVSIRRMACGEALQRADRPRITDALDRNERSDWSTNNIGRCTDAAVRSSARTYRPIYQWSRTQNTSDEG